MKDLSVLDKDISQSIIVDNSPMSYIFHPGMHTPEAICALVVFYNNIYVLENAIDCTSFFDDPSDVELWQVSWMLDSIAQAVANTIYNVFYV